MALILIEIEAENGHNLVNIDAITRICQTPVGCDLVFSDGGVIRFAHPVKDVQRTIFDLANKVLARMSREMEGAPADKKDFN